MEFILFLVSVLIAALFYLRLSKRFNSFDVELSDEIRREMTGLITEFNHSAQQNITLIEEKINEGKSTTKELIDQLNYLKSFKEGLENDIKETQLKIHQLREDEKVILEEQLKQKSLITTTYNRLNKQMSKIQVQNSNMISKIGEEEEDILNIESQNNVVDIYKKAILIQESSSQQKKKSLKENKEFEAEPLVPIEMVIHKNLAIPIEEPMSIKERILELKMKGLNSSEIATYLNLTLGEVQLTLRLFMDED